MHGLLYDVMRYVPLYILVLFAFLFSCGGAGTGSADAEQLASQNAMYVDRNRLDSAMLLNLGILENVDTTCADNFALVAQTYNNLGDIFYKATIFGKALTMYANSLGYACHLSDKTEESHARRGIWRCSYVMDLPCKDTAIANYASLLPRIKSAKEISSLYNNITGYFMYRGMLDSAFIYNGIAVLKSVDSLTLYRNYSVRSELFIEMQNYDSARYYAALALKSNDIYTRAASAFRLSHATEHENNDTSIYYLKYYGALLDSINNIKTSDSINTILYKKQLSSVQDTMSRSHAVMAVMAVVLVLAIGGLAMLFVKAAHGKNAMRREADSLKQRLSELNEELDTNRREAEAMQAKYTEQYMALMSRQNFIEETFAQQLIATRNKCVAAFKKNSFYKKLLASIDGGEQILPVESRKELQKVVGKDFMPLNHSMATYFNISEEEFLLYCLDASGLSTKECAACRGVTVSAIRMQRMRMNNKIKSFFRSDADLSNILL